MAIEEENEGESEEEESAEDNKEGKVQFEEPEKEAKEEPQTGRRLDLEVEASGFGRAMQRELEDVSSSGQPW